MEHTNKTKKYIRFNLQRVWSREWMGFNLAIWNWLNLDFWQGLQKMNYNTKSKVTEDNFEITIIPSKKLRIITLQKGFISIIISWTVINIIKPAESSRQLKIPNPREKFFQKISPSCFIFTVRTTQEFLLLVLYSSGWKISNPDDVHWNEKLTCLSGSSIRSKNK